MLGTEVPPLVFFKEVDGTFEIIDGRQRFETLKRFINNEFSLKKSGLTKFKKFHNKYFKDLPKELQDLFLETNLRVFEYSPLGDFENNSVRKNIVKKEIFTRYNSGMTPLRPVEVDKALFINNDLNKILKNNIQKDKKLKELLFQLLMPEKYSQDIEKPDNLERLLKKIRFLLVIDNIPIQHYSWKSGKNDLINKFFEHFSVSAASTEECWDGFCVKIDALSRVYKSFIETNREYNYLVFESLFWALSVLNKEKKG